MSHVNQNTAATDGKSFQQTGKKLPDAPNGGGTVVQPVRLRLSRARGFNLQEASRALNGLPAVNVARPSAFGNPFVIGRSYPIEQGGIGGECLGETVISDARDASDAFEAWATDDATPLPDPARLRGKNLACWCVLPAPGEPDHCHAAVLLRLANVRCEAASAGAPDIAGAA